jgi:hypothetical protein
MGLKEDLQDFYSIEENRLRNDGMDLEYFLNHKAEIMAAEEIRIQEYEKNSKKEVVTIKPKRKFLQQAATF